MATVAFTPNLARHVACPTADVAGATVREVLDRVFADNQRLRGYVVDEQGALRHHMVVFVDGRQIQDRQHLSDPVPPEGEVYVMQALSGGCCEGEAWGPRAQSASRVGGTSRDEPEDN